MKFRNQHVKLIQHMVEQGSVTAEIAQTQLGIRGFTARISDLRAMNFNIQARTIPHSGGAKEYSLGG